MGADRSSTARVLQGTKIRSLDDHSCPSRWEMRETVASRYAVQKVKTLCLRRNFKEPPKKEG